MDFDLSDYLASWPFDPENPISNFRRVEGSDGRGIIQVREPMGIQQMDYHGRPDGVRIEGRETWLDYYGDQAEVDPDFSLDHDDCMRLMQEGVLFYQRYLILYQMEDWPGVVRDTERNIDYYKFLKQYAENSEDEMAIAQYRPYIIRMNGIAKAQLLWENGEFKPGITLLKDTLHEIEGLEPVPTPVFKMEMEKATKHLHQLIDEFEKDRPESQREQLEREKVEAVRREDFEEAARLRDRIRNLGSSYARKN